MAPPIVIRIPFYIGGGDFRRLEFTVTLRQLTETFLFPCLLCQ